MYFNFLVAWVTCWFWFSWILGWVLFFYWITPIEFKFGDWIIISSSESSSFLMIICLFFKLLGNISYLASLYYFVNSGPPFLSYLTLSA